MQKKYIAPVIILLCVAQLLSPQLCGAQTYNISTVAGNGTAGYAGDAGQATAAELNLPSSVTVDLSGNIYIGDAQNNRIRKINAAGVISTFAGNGSNGYAGDGGQATAAELNNAEGVAADYAGNVFIADEYNQRIRLVTVNNNISTFAGNGKVSFSGDGGPATNAQMFFPIGIARDASGNIYIADCWNHRIRMINTLGNISTIAGTGVAGYSGDGGQATAAKLNFPNGIAIDGSGNIYIADNNNNRIRKINTSGIISTFAGNGWGWYSGDGGQATAATLNNPNDIAIDASSGNIYIADKNNNVIRMVNISGVISTVAGTGSAGFGGDGGLATAAQLNKPMGVAIDASGNLYIADNNNNRIREVVPTGSISSIAGTGTAGYNGDGITATSAELNNPVGVWVDGSGKVYIGDAGNNRIRQISGTYIYTVAGNGVGGFAGDGSPATAAKINTPAFVTVDGSGNIYFTDDFNQRVREVNASGIISTLGGNGNLSFSGDGKPADSAQLFFPTCIARDATGNTYIADCFNHRIRKVSTNGIISTFAGNGNWGYGGDGGQATSAELFFPTGVAADASGNIYIADGSNNRIRKVNTSGVISTFAGNGAAGYIGDGGPATLAELNDPTGVAVDLFGNVLIADKNNGRIRVVNSSGVISTIAGNGTQSYSGDGGPATSAELNNPWSVTADYSGNVYVADYSNNRVRKLTPNCYDSVTISNIKNVTCIGAGDGSATATASGGTPPYTYSWVPSGGTGSAASGLTAGTYTVNVHDAGSCSGSATVTITRPPYTINTYAGNGAGGDAGDGGQATAAELSYPVQIAMDGSGNLYIADFVDNKIRKVTPSGTITTIAGNGSNGFSGDGGQATNAELGSPPGVAVDGAGNIYIADQANDRIRVVNSSGIISTFAGNGGNGFSGNGGQATAAELSYPADVAIDSKGNVYIDDAGNECIRQVTPAGIISTYAGNTKTGFSGDGGPATNAELDGPVSISIDGADNLYIADLDNYRIRMVTPSGIITTIAGSNSVGGFYGDGGPATAAELNKPWKAVADPAGNIYIADASNERVRMIDKTGTIVTIAGNGTAAFSGDGGLARKAELSNPDGLALDASGNLYIADQGNNRVRKLYACPYCSLTTTASVVNNVSCNGNSDGSAQAIASAGIGQYTYSWSPVGGTSAAVSGLGSGTYVVTVIDSIGCTATASVVLSGPVVSASISGPDSICLGDVVTLTASGGNTYSWNNGDTTASITISPTTDSIYVVTVYSGPCSDTLSHPIYVSTDGSVCKLTFYTGITPNGDGHNDYWQIDNIELFPDNTVDIYNRWGLLVWSAKGYDNNRVSWKGQNNAGAPLPDGTYFYVVTASNKSYKGWVQLTR